MPEKNPDPKPRPGFLEQLQQLFGGEPAAERSGNTNPDSDLEGQDRSDPFERKEANSDARLNPERASWWGRLRGVLGLESLHDGDR
ncbi:MAG: hypothetical protein ACO4CF_14095, partial [bacterium]